VRQRGEHLPRRELGQLVEVVGRPRALQATEVTARVAEEAVVSKPAGMPHGSSRLLPLRSSSSIAEPGRAPTTGTVTAARAIVFGGDSRGTGLNDGPPAPCQVAGACCPPG